MRKSLEAIKGDKLQNIRNNKIYLVGDVSESFLLVDVETQIAKLYTKANIRRWFRMLYYNATIRACYRLCILLRTQVVVAKLTTAIME